MSISDKLTYLNGTKTAIKNAIVDKGVTVPQNATFRDYATLISQISGSGAVKYLDSYNEANNYFDTSMPVNYTHTVAESGIYVAFCNSCSQSTQPSISSTGDLLLTKSFEGTDSGHTRKALIEFFQCEVGDTITLTNNSDTSSVAGLCLIKNCNSVAFRSAVFNVDATSTNAATSSGALLAISMVTGQGGHRTIEDNTLEGDCVTRYGVYLGVSTGANDIFGLVLANENADFDISAYGWSHGSSLVAYFDLT